MSKGLVLVTGANGYLGSHIVHILLEDGWAVRALTRAGRSDGVKNTFPDVGDNLQTVEADDIIDGDLSEAVKGIDAIIHTVSPGFGASVEGMFHGNIEGTLNLFKAGIAAGVKKLVYTSSVITLFDIDLSAPFKAEVLDETAWSDITRDQIDSSNTSIFDAYIHSKTIAEKEFWKLADEHKDVDFTALLPSMIIGARLPRAPKPSTRVGLSTINFIYYLLDGGKAYPPNPSANYVHVKDIARAHVTALSVGPLPDGRRKRLIVTAPNSFSWLEASDIIREERPELREKTVPKETQAVPQFSTSYDTSLTEQVLGLKDYVGFKEALLETVDYLIEWEKN